MKIYNPNVKYDLNVTGSVQVTGSMSVSDNIEVDGIDALNYINTKQFTVTGLTTVSEVKETVFIDTVDSSVSDFNLDSGSIFVIGSINQTATFNITNVPEDNGSAISVVFFIPQGVTAYSASAFQINSTPVTPYWSEKNIPTGSANTINLIGLSIFRYSDQWSVLASMNTFKN